MKIFWIILLLLSSFFFSISCNSIKGYSKLANPNELSKINKPILDSTISTAVYKAKINIYNKYFSGLFLFKYLPIDSSLHVVFLSEVGLNLLDLQFKNNKFNVVHCQDFLNRKSLINTFKNDFSMLLNNSDLGSNFKYLKNYRDSTIAIKYKYNKDKIYVFINNKNQIYRIYKKAFPFGSVNLHLKNDINGQVEEIRFKHKGIKLEINLSRLNKTE